MIVWCGVVPSLYGEIVEWYVLTPQSCGAAKITLNLKFSPVFTECHVAQYMMMTDLMAWFPLSMYVFSIYPSIRIILLDYTTPRVFGFVSTRLLAVCIG